MKIGRVSAGHPVDVATGMMFTARHDAEIPGMISLVWRAFYSTSLLDQEPTILGHGWRHPFMMTLEHDLDGYIFRDAEGACVAFDDIMGVVEDGGVIINLSSCMELRCRGDLYEILHWHVDDETVIRYVFRGGTEAAPMLLEAMEDLWGNRLNITYDSTGRFLSVRQSLEQRQLSVIYNEKGLADRLLLHSPNSNDPRELARYEYDDNDCLVAAINPLGYAATYRYDERNRLISEINRTGGIYTMKYDSLGRCIESGGVNGYQHTTFAYLPEANCTTVTNSLRHVISYFYNDAGQVERTVYPNGATFVNEYDEHGRIVGQIDPLSRRHRFIYDARGDRVEEHAPSSAITRIDYNELHLPTRVTDPDGATTSFAYDSQFRLIAMIDPLDAETRYERTPQGVLSRIITPTGEIIEVGYAPDWTQQQISDRYMVLTRHLNDLLKVSRETDATSDHISYEHDAKGYVTAITHPDGVTVRLQRDGEGRVIQLHDGNGNVKKLRYSPYGDLLEATNALGHRVQFRWDTEGQLLTVEDALGHVSKFQYDMVGNVCEKTFFDERIERYEYDLANQLVKIHRPDHTIIEYGYDNDGNRIYEAYPDGLSIDKRYNMLGQLTTATCGESEIAFEYDLRGNLIAEVQDGVHVECKYDSAGDIIQREFGKSAIGALEFEFDDQGCWIVSTRSRILEKWEFGPTGLLTTRELGRATETFRYDQRRRMAEQLVGRQGVEILRRHFNYDAEDNLTSLSDSLRGQTQYQYDGAEQLIASYRRGRNPSIYAYDACGNLIDRGSLSRWEVGVGNRLLRDDNTFYEYGTNSEVVAAVTDGRRTTYSWDGKQRLVKVSHPNGTETSFGYDALDRRIWKEHRGIRTRFYWQGNDLIAEEHDGVVREFLYRNGQPCLMWENGKTFHIVCSHVQAPTELVDDRGELLWHGLYDDWGALVSPSSANHLPPLRLPGQYADLETGLHYNRHRYYDPGTGRYLSPDPLGLFAGLNEYIYAPNPVNWTDPLGLDCDKVGCRAAARRVRRRVRRMQAEMTEGERGRQTYVVAEVLSPDGNIEVWVSSAGRDGYVRPGIRQTSGADFVIQSPSTRNPDLPRINDAERAILRQARREGTTILGIGATRPVCDHCRDALSRSGYVEAIATD